MAVVPPMVVHVTYREDGPVVRSILQYLTFSAILKALSLVTAVVTTVAAFNEPSFMAGLEDTKLYLGVLMTLSTFFAKSTNEHGTATAPIPPAQAAQIAAVAASIPIPPSMVGDQITPTVYSAKPGDTTPDGFEVKNDPRGVFTKHIEGTSGYYTKG